MECDKITAREFSAHCKAHGFSQRGKVFTRCIGDGIFQVISAEHRQYMDISAPEYTSKNRKSISIAFNLWSMYTNLPDYFFSEGKYLGYWGPEFLIGQHPNKTPFMGVQSHYCIMIERGLDFLDSINTQKKLIDAIIKLETFECGSPLFHRVELCEPFIICEEYQEAIYRLNGMIMQNYSAFHSNCDHLKCEGNLDEYVRRLDEYYAKIKPMENLSWACILNKKDKILEWLKSNFYRNYQLAKENKIAFSDDFKPINFEKIFKSK